MLRPESQIWQQGGGPKALVARFSAAFESDACEEARLAGLQQQLHALPGDFAVHLLLDLTQLVVAWRVEIALSLGVSVTQSLLDKHPEQAQVITAKLQEQMQMFRERLAFFTFFLVRLSKLVVDLPPSLMWLLCI